MTGVLGGMLVGSAYAATFGNYVFELPAGWTQAKQGGGLVLTLPPKTAGDRATIRLTAGAVLSGELRTWFAAQVAAFNKGAAVLSQSETQADTDENGLPVLATVVVVEVGTGSEWRLFAATKAGNRAEMLVFSASSLESFTAHQAELTAFTDRLNFANVKAPATAGTTKTATPTVKASGSLPTVPAPNVAQLVRAGLNPRKQPFPDEFRCYLSVQSSDYSKPAFALQILPGGRYRAPGGEGTYKMVQSSSSSSLNYLRWQGGPLAGTDDAYLLFDSTYGQTIQLDGVTDQDRRLYCHQRGSAESHALVEFRRKDPQVGKYPCRSLDGKNTDLGTLELLAGRVYRYKGSSGKYAVNIMGKQRDSFSGVDFVGGPLDEEYSTYSEDELGEREFGRILRNMRCSQIAKPIVEPTFGTAKAPAPPAGSGGIEGAYSQTIQNFYPNASLEHYFYIFNKNGYVFTGDPETSLADADCTKTRPNGLPLCEVYSIKNGLLTIGTDKPEKWERTASGYKLDGENLKAVKPLGNLKLAGDYQAISTFTAVMGSGGGVFYNNLTFRKDGTFTRVATGGVSITTTTDGTAFGETTGGVSSSSERKNSGTYTLSGNTLTLTYGDGRVEKQFAYLPSTENGKPDLEWLYVGGRNYFLDDGK
ncbi:hypothetical protein E7T06_15535 [Deinococcus sp. Arct2-2]|uniref:lipocalin family protein n=1 Tax=Deinococcus sp. Arct2-2 TaxID=2568653 RepID=UPI0010A43B69|nr:lipocalin family protein [Deinococcus sp. Arct2-2]THF68687.1 hypothetical protein E7T06_15535 [Deinococcus sp. Arct2-2]